MLSKIKSHLATATLRQSAITTASTLVNGSLGAVFYYVLAGFLVPSEFGSFSLAAAMIILFSSVLNLGTDQGMVKFIASAQNDARRQDLATKISLWVKIAAGLAAVIIAFLLSSALAELLYKSSSASIMVKVVGIGVLGQLLFSFASARAQALEKYYVWGGLFISANLGRLLLTLGLFSAGQLSALSALGAYVLVLFLGFFIGTSVLGWGFITRRGEGALLSQLFSFNKWTMAFTSLSAVGSRVDTLFTAALTNLSSTGVYSLSSQTASLFSQITSSVGAVTSPKYASFDSPEKNTAYTRKAVLFTAGLSLGLTALILPTAFLLFQVYGAQYASGWGPLLLLLLSMNIFLVTSPISDSILFFHTRPQFFFWLSLAQITLTAAAGFLLIPGLGLMGSALSVLITRIVLSAITVLYFKKLSV